MPTFEHRAAPNFDAVEFRAAKDGGTTFHGYAAVFNSPSKPIFDPRENSVPFVESITPGAFARTLTSGRRQTFVVDHNDALHISATDGPLRLAEDSRGLIVESPWPKTDYADNVRALQRALGGRGLGLWQQQPDKAWVEGFPEARSYVRRLANKHRYGCPLLGSDLNIILRQGQLALAQAFYRQERFQEAADVYAKLKAGQITGRAVLVPA